MTVDKLLVCLEGVKKTGVNKWQARCPAHSDRTASLSIREVENGVVLAHCFAGCDFQEIMNATGLDASDLYPETTTHRSKPVRRPFAAIDALHAIAHESLIVLICASDTLAGKLLESDRERLVIAVERIQQANTACGVHHGR